MKFRFSSTLAITAALGVLGVIAGSLVPSAEWSTALSLLGGALLIAVAIRVLAALAGLHAEAEPALRPGEKLLTQSFNATLLGHSPAVWGPSWGAPRTYRATLTTERILLSVRIWGITTGRDATIASLLPGQPLSLQSIDVKLEPRFLQKPDGAVSELSPAETPGNITLKPVRRFGPRWKLRLADAGRWALALEETHPELLRQT